MTAEAIATVVADLRANNVAHVDRDSRLIEFSDGLLTDVMQPAPVVDATAIYRSIMAKEGGVYLYEDHNVCAPWDASFITYVNEHGNVMVCASIAYDVEPTTTPRWEPSSEGCDWGLVEHVLGALVYVGGTSKKGPVPTTGPVHAWSIAAYADGGIADIHWHQILTDHELESWDMALTVLLGTLTFFGARNVELVEPIRPRGVRRRIERTGVSVRELVVFPKGKSTRGRDGTIATGGIPLTSVRGHYAKYGMDGRGKLFGKHTGRYWIPAHARGDAEHGEVQHNYRIET